MCSRTRTPAQDLLASEPSGLGKDESLPAASAAAGSQQPGLRLRLDSETQQEPFSANGLDSGTQEEPDLATRLGLQPGLVGKVAAAAAGSQEGAQTEEDAAGAAEEERQTVASVEEAGSDSGEDADGEAGAPC